eukprot:TCONS_00073448-protein
MIDEDSNLTEPEKDDAGSCDEGGNTIEISARLISNKNQDSEKEDENEGTAKDEDEHEEGSDDNDDGSEDDDDDDEDEDSEDSDSLGEEEAETRKTQYVTDMSDLEKQFSDLKEQLYKEQISQIESQLKEVNSSEAKEYTGPLKQIEQECIIRTEVAWQLKHYRTINLENKLQCELQAAEQHFQNQERQVYDTIASDFEDKLKKVEEERHTSEMYSGNTQDLWCEDTFRSRKKRNKGMEIHVPEKRKKPATVTGPYVIYMLNEMDILEDWAAIRKAKSELARRKALELSSQDRDPLITARYEDGKFFYENEWFQKGDSVVLDNRIDSPVQVTIAGINTGEVWVSKTDGVKCKLYIAQFQKGKYVISRGLPTVDEII